MDGQWYFKEKSFPGILKGSLLPHARLVHSVLAFSQSILWVSSLCFLKTTTLEAPRLAVTNEPSDASLSTGSTSRRRGQKTASLARSSNYLVHRPREGLCPRPGVRSCLPGRLPSHHSYIYLAPGQISAHTGTDLKLYLESAQPSLPLSPLHGS